MTGTAAQRFASEFARVADGLPGRAPWLRELREAALERFLAKGLPGARDEEWKYTSLAPLERRSFIADGDARALPQHAIAEVVARAALAGGHRLVFVNGRFSPAHSAIGSLPAGASLDSLAAALDRDDERVRAALADRRDETVLGELNAAFMVDGFYLHLAPGVALDEPVHVLFVAAGADAAVQVRNLVVAETRAAATVIEHYAAVEGATHFTNAVTQVRTDEAAALVHCKLQEESIQALHVAGIHAVQARDSRWVSHSIALGAALARNDITTAFAAPGCHATLNGLYVVGGRQHVDHHTRIDHAEPGGTSREFYRGVLDGRARGVFNGKVIVHPHAQRTDAQQANHNLLLSRDAEIDTKPQLEIWADDVKCSHGATVGQLDDNQIFYLRSRGLEEGIARSVLTYAFAVDVVQRIEVPAVRERLARTLLARLPEGDRIKELA